MWWKVSPGRRSRKGLCAASWCSFRSVILYVLLQAHGDRWRYATCPRESLQAFKYSQELSISFKPSIPSTDPSSGRKWAMWLQIGSRKRWQSLILHLTSGFHQFLSIVSILGSHYECICGEVPSSEVGPEREKQSFLPSILSPPYGLLLGSDASAWSVYAWTKWKQLPASTALSSISFDLYHSSSVRSADNWHSAATSYAVSYYISSKSGFYATQESFLILSPNILDFYTLRLRCFPLRLSSTYKLHDGS